MSVTNPQFYWPPASVSGFNNLDARSQSIALYQSTKIAVAGYFPYGAGSAPGASLFSFDTTSEAWSDLRVDGAYASNCFQQVASTNYTVNDFFVAPSTNGILAIGFNGVALQYSPSGILTATNFGSGSGTLNAAGSGSGVIYAFAFDNSLTAQQDAQTTVTLAGNRNGAFFTAATGAAFGTLTASGANNYASIANGYVSGQPFDLLFGSLPANPAGIGSLNTGTGATGSFVAGPASVLIANTPNFGSIPTLPNLVSAYQEASYRQCLVSPAVSLASENGNFSLGYVPAAQIFCNAFAQNPANTSLVLGATAMINAAGTALLSEAVLFSNQAGGSTNNWQLINSLPLTNLNKTGTYSYGMSCAWSTNGVYGFIADPSSNTVSILEYSLGSLTFVGTGTVAGLGKICAATDGASLFAISSTGISVAQFVGTTWNFNEQFLTIPNCFAIYSWKNTTTNTTINICGTTSGFYFLSESAGAWSLGTKITLGFTPTMLFVDSYGVIYAANSTNFVSLSSTGTIIASGVYGGTNCVSMFVYQGQALISDPSSNQVFILGSDSGTSWTLKNTMAFALPPGNIMMANATVFISYGNAASTGGYSAAVKCPVCTLFYKFGAPFEVEHVRTGLIADLLHQEALYFFGVDVVPTAIYTRATSAGILGYVTAQNNALYVFDVGSTAGVINLIETAAVPNQPGQSSSIPVGAASIVVEPAQVNGNDVVWVGCSMFGGLINFQLTGT